MYTLFVYPIHGYPWCICRIGRIGNASLRPTGPQLHLIISLDEGTLWKYLPGSFSSVSPARTWIKFRVHSCLLQKPIISTSIGSWISFSNTPWESTTSPRRQTLMTENVLKTTLCENMVYHGLQWLTMAYLQVLDGFRQNFRQRCPGNWLIGWTTDEKHMPQFLRITITRWRVAFERETTDQQEVRAVDRGSPYYIQRLLVVERDFCVWGQEHSRAHSQQQPQISNKLCAWGAVWMATVCQWSELHFRGAWCIGHASSVFA